MAKSRLTLQQIASRTGVSTPTISRVLNGRPDVAPATRERVLKVLRESDYKPRGASAVPTSTGHIEVVFDALANPNNQYILRGVIAAAEADGVYVGVSIMPDRVAAATWAHNLARAGRAGVIVVTSRLTAEQLLHLRQDSLPLVLVDPINPIDEVPSVGVNNWQGGLRATQHLIELGHRRIALLRGYECLVDDARYQGYLSALGAAGIAADPTLAVRTDFQFEPAVEASMNLLSQPNPPTAIFAANDMAALGAIRASQSLGMTVPDDLSVVGFDDSVYASVCTPGLTTIAQPLSEMGETAYRLLADQIRGLPRPSANLELSAILVRRDSTGAPR
jgi:LacI family transcriptional regulator